MSDYLPTDYKERKALPIMEGVLDYFPLALLAVARVSVAGNKQHNGDEPLHWARGKSMDQVNTLLRHLMERGTLDTDGVPHTAKAAWRVLALLQIEEERRLGLPPSRASRLPAPSILDNLDKLSPERRAAVVARGRQLIAERVCGAHDATSGN